MLCQTDLRAGYVPVPGEGAKVGNRSAAREEGQAPRRRRRAMIRMVLADMLCELGYTVAAEAASIDEALEATRKTDFDFAILDADLKGRSVSRLPMPSSPATYGSSL